MLNYAELTHWNEYTKLFIGLFALVSPPIIWPLFIGLVGHRSNQEKRQTALVGAVGFAVIMLTFTFFGQSILNLFGITISAFRIAGGILLLLTALEMMRSEITVTEEDENNASENALSLGLVPLAMPILAGPGAVSTLIIFAGIHESFSHQLVVAIVVVTLTIYLLLAFQFAITSGRFLGKTAVIVFYRIMGLIIAAIAVEFILDGIAAHFPALGTIH